MGGSPHNDALPIFCDYFGAKDRLSLSVTLGDDFYWIGADFACWRPPDHTPVFDTLGGQKRSSHAQAGVFAECEDVRTVEAFPWPDARHLDLDLLERMTDEALLTGMGMAGGAWSSVFTNTARFFGLENYFVKMYTDPDVVDAVTAHVTQFYLDANERIFARLGKRLDVLFMGSDLGTQLDLMISPECFRRFVLPAFQKIIAQAKRYDLPVIFHCCGAIDKIIPDLIDAGIDALHPLQALAKGMDAANLAKYKKDLLFIGGVDTQELMMNGSVQDIKDEVRRIAKLLGPGWIASPSHEALLPNTPPQNLEALRDAVAEIS